MSCLRNPCANLFRQLNLVLCVVMRAVLGLNLILLSLVADARCLNSPVYLVELVVNACNSISGTQNDERGAIVDVDVLAQIDLQSLRGDLYLDNVRIERYEPPGKREYFYQSDDPNICGLLSSRGKVVLREFSPCCDVMPISEIVCGRQWLGEISKDEIEMYRRSGDDA